MPDSHPLKALGKLSSLLLAPLAKRFVAGESADQAIAAAVQANGKGIGAILDYLGEDVSTKELARAAVQEYVELLRKIREKNVRAAVSLKVSQMGIRLSKDLCLEHLRRVAQEAAALGLFIWIDMEGSALTQKTLEAFDVLRLDFKNVGLCLQAYLVRTGGDVDYLARRPFSLRLCKGAYKEPSSIAYSAKSAVDGNFRMLVQKTLDLVRKGLYPAFATHDPRMIDHVIALCQEKKIPREQFEFQMLYGIQKKRLEALANAGYRANVYIPYGTHWLPYFIRRIKERRENLYFLMRNVFQR